VQEGSRIGRPKLLAAAILLLSACASTPMRWERSGTADPSNDEAACRGAAHQEAIRRLPYGDGPPIFTFPKMSRLQWTQAIDNERAYLERDLMAICMHDRGFVLVPVPATTEGQRR
jgi:hypothetical protein